ncbi:MAG: hypothetical protein ACRDKW_10455, partial [Actinomycetota bacterium]
SGCRKQLRQQQFDEGGAFHVHERILCARCARKEIRRLPESARRALLAHVEKSRQVAGDGTKTSRILRAVTLSRSGTHHRPSTPQQPKMLGYLLAATGIFLMLAVLLASANASSGRGRSARPALPASSTQR